MCVLPDVRVWAIGYKFGKNMKSSYTSQVGIEKRSNRSKDRLTVGHQLASPSFNNKKKSIYPSLLILDTYIRQMQRQKPKRIFYCSSCGTSGKNRPPASNITDY